jgi:hypothetical protein
MAQIAFLTLFLGLTLGRQPVELTVSGPVAAVELLLDGAAVGRVEGPEWKGEVDFGPSLVPHQLAARALDASGKEIGRAQQWVNLPRPAAEVEILLENGANGRPAAARLTWQSLTGERPAGVRVTFDEKNLTADPGGRVKLPAWDPETSHVLTAELRFSGALAARRDVVFGGRWGDQTSTELTGVPARLRPGKALPSPEAMAGWLRAGGQPLTVAAVEEGPAELLVVRDLALPKEIDRWLFGGTRTKPTLSMRGSVFDERSTEFHRFEMTLGKEDAIRFIWPLARAAAGPGVPAELFDESRTFDARDGGLLWFLARYLPREGNPARQRLADAVAVAGLQALYANHRRAVLLVLSEKPLDASRSDPAVVRRYLESIRVPLIVWTFGEPAAPEAAAWGPAEKVSSLGKMKKAFSHLEKELAAQHILWVDGLHLPQSIELSPEAAAVLETVR